MNYKCIIVTPAGRRRYLKHLLFNLEKQTAYFNEWHLWDNTRTDVDRLYIYSLQSQYSWIKVIDRTVYNQENFLVDSKYQGSLIAINRFYDYTIDKSTIYIRLDDDIVWLDDDFIKTFKQFRIDHPKNTLVIANIINNNITAHLQQKNGKVLQKFPKIDYDCTGNYYKNPEFAFLLHEEFSDSRLNKETHLWKFPDHIVSDFKRISINAISWFGDNFEDLSKHYHGEETYLTEILPKKRNNPILICGNALCLHFAFNDQRCFKYKNDKLDDKLYEFVGYFEELTIV